MSLELQPRADLLLGRWSQRVAAVVLGGIIAVLAGALSSCGRSRGENQFSQRPAFVEIIGRRSSELPNQAEMALLEQHKPALYLPFGHEGPLDFYRDYIAAGCLVTAQLPEPNCAVTQADLNRSKNDPTAVFTHRRATRTQTVHPVAYASVHRGTVFLSGHSPPEQEWLFLVYNFAFRFSGLAAGLSWWQSLGAALIGDLDDWHQLDHYTSVVVALDGNQRRRAVMLQQHNYMHTYLAGAEEPAFPARGSIAVDVAIRSNELYPHREGRTSHPAVNFLSPRSAAYVAGVASEPILAAADITASSDKQSSYQLTYLPPDDAFYIFAGRLGEHRLLPGRDGPPGAIFYTLPEFMFYEKSLLLFFWRVPDQDFADLMAASERADWVDYLLARQRERFARALAELE